MRRFEGCPNCGTGVDLPHAEWCWDAHPDQPVLSNVAMRPVNPAVKSGHWEPDPDRESWHDSYEIDLEEEEAS